MKTILTECLSIKYPIIAAAPYLVSQQKRRTRRLKNRPFVVNIEIINPNTYNCENQLKRVIF